MNTPWKVIVILLVGVTCVALSLFFLLKPSPLLDTPQILSGTDDEYAIILQERELSVSSADGLLRNDFTPHRDALRVTRIVTPPHHAIDGGFSWSADGSFRYRPCSGWPGGDTFVYEVTDGAHIAQATVTLRCGVFRRGQPTDLTVVSTGGLLLRGGGGGDFARSISRILHHANGGDIVILDASGDPQYMVDSFWNLPQSSADPALPFRTPNSITCFTITHRQESGSKEAAMIAAHLLHAEAIYIAGGDQSKYIDFWKGTPVQDALQHAIDRKTVVIGGSSAGFAVLGHIVYRGSPHATTLLTSDEALGNPYHEDISLFSPFLRIPLLHDTITDSHFGNTSVDSRIDNRKRMGRLVTFLARSMVDDLHHDALRGLGIDANTALWIDAQGCAEVLGDGFVYFLLARTPPELCVRTLPPIPLQFSGVHVRRVRSGGAPFTFADAWDVTQCFGDQYQVSARGGSLTSSRHDGTVY